MQLLNKVSWAQLHSSILKNFLTPVTIRCQVNWQLGVNLGVSLGAEKLLDIAAVSGRSQTSWQSQHTQKRRPVPIPESRTVYRRQNPPKFSLGVARPLATASS